MILNVHALTKSFNGEDILQDVSFHIEKNEKAAIVGINGSGKTTLLKLILRQLKADSGSVTYAKDLRIGYLAQNQDLSGDHTIFEELSKSKRDLITMEKELTQAEEAMKHLSGKELEELSNRYVELQQKFSEQKGYAWRSEVQGVARGLGFSDDEMQKQISALSGGQKTRVALGKLLLTSPDLILLDEPTNHLDMASVSWLETYLKNVDSAVLIVSHDRYFLDRIVSKVIEIDQTHASVYLGNYTAYSEKKAKDRATRWHAYLKQQQIIKHQEDVITKLKSYNREKSIKRAESREKMLSKMERLKRPTEAKSDMHIALIPSCESGNDVLHVEDLTKSFGTHSLFSHLDFDVKRGEKVAIIGKNGTGKTTLLKIIQGLVAPNEGYLQLGTKVHIGYYDQEHHVLHDQKTLFDEISDAYPTLNNTQIRSTLAAFLFTGDDVYKQISMLSGGEKGRMSLAKLMLSDANFLLLDEPTNHLDIVSKEILESAVSGYEGTVLYVSHDRYFINRTATRILELTNCKQISYIGNYDDYLDHCEERHAQMEEESARGSSLPPAKAMQTETKDASPAGGKEDWKTQKEYQAKKRKQEAELARTEQEIEQLEARDKEINEALQRPEIATDLAKLRKFTDEQEALQTRLHLLYDRWEELQ